MSEMPNEKMALMEIVDMAIREYNCQAKAFMRDATGDNDYIDDGASLQPYDVGYKDATGEIVSLIGGILKKYRLGRLVTGKKLVTYWEARFEEFPYEGEKGREKNDT